MPSLTHRSDIFSKMKIKIVCEILDGSVVLYLGRHMRTGMKFFIDFVINVLK